MSARAHAPDSWYHFHNPTFTGAYAFDGSNPLPPYTIEFNITENKYQYFEGYPFNRRLRSKITFLSMNSFCINLTPTLLGKNRGC
jgi:hypothetical protein